MYDATMQAARLPVLVDTEAIACHIGVPAGTIRRWAHEDGWPPHGTRRFRKWNLWDAEKSWADRHARHADQQVA